MDTGQCLSTLLGHSDEILDVCFNYSGQLIATASADGKTPQLPFLFVIIV